MRNKYGNKGQMRVIEAILAAFIIVLALSFVNFFATNPTSQKYETTELDKMGYNTLHDLDLQGILAQYVYNQEWDNLGAALSVTLPVDVYFNMTIFDMDRTVINNAPILYGQSGTFMDSKVVSSITYTLVGYSGGSTQDWDNLVSAYNPRVLVLQLVRG
jgi:hypothetical protein